MLTVHAGRHHAIFESDRTVVLDLHLHDVMMPAGVAVKKVSMAAFIHETARDGYHALPIVDRHGAGGNDALGRQNRAWRAPGVQIPLKARGIVREGGERYETRRSPPAFWSYFAGQTNSPASAATVRGWS